MALEKNLTTLKPGDKVYARRVDAKETDFDIYTLTVQAVCLKDATGHWTNHIVDVDWGYQGSEHGTYKYKKGFIIIDEWFSKDPNKFSNGGKYVCIPIDEHSVYNTRARIFTTEGVEIDVSMSKEYFLEKFRKTLESKRIDTARAVDGYESLKKELESLEN